MPSYTTLLAPARQQVHPRGQQPERPLVSLPENAPERRLLAAIIALAARDMAGRYARAYSGPGVAHDAAQYVAGENFEFDCLALGYDPDVARERLAVYVHRSLHPEASL